MPTDGEASGWHDQPHPDNAGDGHDRQNTWLHSDTVAGAKASATVYRLMLTCRACGVENGVQQSDVAAGSIGTLKSGRAIEPKRS
uniref:Uncharacterized protein n=1 Tax=Ralstonia solanacearum TaxID=305 RepID=A0A0S4UHG0_RALSL|nr:protein of unknown function [Ralstonia solanacearum]